MVLRERRLKHWVGLVEWKRRRGSFEEMGLGEIGVCTQALAIARIQRCVAKQQTQITFADHPRRKVSAIAR